MTAPHDHDTSPGVEIATTATLTAVCPRCTTGLTATTATLIDVFQPRHTHNRCTHHIITCHDCNTRVDLVLDHDTLPLTVRVSPANPDTP